MIYIYIYIYIYIHYVLTRTHTHTHTNTHTLYTCMLTHTHIHTNTRGSKHLELSCSASRCCEDGHSIAHAVLVHKLDSIRQGSGYQGSGVCVCVCVCVWCYGGVYHACIRVQKTNNACAGIFIHCAQRYEHAREHALKSASSKQKRNTLQHVIHPFTGSRFFSFLSTEGQRRVAKKRCT